MYIILTEKEKDIKIGSLATIRKLNLNKDDLLLDKTIYYNINNLTYVRAVLYDLENKNRKFIQTASEKKRMAKFAKDNNLATITDKEYGNMQFDEFSEIEEISEAPVKVLFSWD